MLAMESPTSVRTSTSCNALLRELQQIWNDIGESEVDKDRMLLELERECLQVYRRKVDEAVNAKARLHQSVAAKEAELATLMAALGELNGHSPIKSPLGTAIISSCFYLYFSASQFENKLVGVVE
ncbi:65-kDa microtubule-associated protein 7 [Camellia lanceoleosa]|uniref:65-kDa microtubule-associated protein 7 n=1 Tax=Camellia lanceoleosa TaxID=1840588 RepID=A0ACC0FWB0_9ERIC|nr:65-kDa microtubule-associated protein 7 [Camellia lanceoleosa]